MKLFLLRATFIRSKFQHRFYFYDYCYNASAKRSLQEADRDPSCPAQSIEYTTYVYVCVVCMYVYGYCWALSAYNMCVKTSCSRLNWLKKENEKRKHFVDSKLSRSAGMLGREIPYTIQFVLKYFLVC